MPRSAPIAAPAGQVTALPLNAFDGMAYLLNYVDVFANLIVLVISPSIEPFTSRPMQTTLPRFVVVPSNHPMLNTPVVPAEQVEPPTRSTLAEMRLLPDNDLAEVSVDEVTFTSADAAEYEIPRIAPVAIPAIVVPLNPLLAITILLYDPCQTV
jgi:hypothetical protein